MIVVMCPILAAGKVKRAIGEDGADEVGKLE